MNKKIGDYFWIFLALIIICVLIGKLIKAHRIYNLSPEHSIRKKAIIFNEKNYWPNHPVRAPFSYSYKFLVGKQEYHGNSHDTTLKIGDTIYIEVDKNDPEINRPLHPKD